MIARLLLTASAYSPVVILTGVRITRPVLSWTLIGAGIAAAAGLFAAVQRARLGSADEPLPVVAISDRAGDVPAYLVGYLLPFVTIAKPTARDLIALTVFGAVLLYVSTRSDIIAVNPWLYLLRLRLFDADLDRGSGRIEKVLLLARDAPTPPRPVLADQAAAGDPVIVGQAVATGLYLVHEP